MNHGWSLTDAALRSYCPTLGFAPLPDGTPPDRRLLDDPAVALRALE